MGAQAKNKCRAPSEDQDRRSRIPERAGVHLWRSLGACRCRARPQRGSHLRIILLDICALPVQACSPVTGGCLPSRAILRDRKVRSRLSSAEMPRLKGGSVDRPKSLCAGKARILPQGMFAAAVTLLSAFKSLRNPLPPQLLSLAKEELGQGIVEYILILALIAFTTTAGMLSLASAVNDAATRVYKLLSAHIS